MNYAGFALNRGSAPIQQYGVFPRFDTESLCGTKLAENLKSAAESYLARFAQRQLDAAKTKLQAELDRRKQEWTMEDDVADAEVVKVGMFFSN